MPYGDLWIIQTLASLCDSRPPAAEQMNDSRLWTAAYSPNSWDTSWKHLRVMESVLPCQNTSETASYIFRIQKHFHIPPIRWNRTLLHLQESLLSPRQHMGWSVFCISRVNQLCPTTTWEEETVLRWNKASSLLSQITPSLPPCTQSHEDCCTTQDYSAVIM